MKVTIISLPEVANGQQQAGMASGQMQDEPVLPTNVPTVFTRVIGTDISRSSVGGLRNVAGLVAFSPNKSYLLNGFGNGSFNPNGATLIIFFNDSNSTNDYDVTVMNGNDSNEAKEFDPSGWDANFGQIYDYNVIGDVLLLVVADGQTFRDPAMFINGSVLRTTGPIFQGNSVLSTNNGPTGNGNLWDVREFDLDPYILTAPGFNNIRLTMNSPLSEGTDDNISLVAAIACVPIGPEKVHITNPRVSGNLENTTQTALLGADVRLQATLYPAGLTGGSFSWTIAGPYQLASGSTNTDVLNVRWTEPGTYNVRVNYARNGVTISSSMNVNVIVPTLSNFSATTNAPDQLNRGRACSQQPSRATIYSLGCEQNTGILFTATAQIPPGLYLTDLAQSGVKMLRFGSEYRKYKVDIREQRNLFIDTYFYDGRNQCVTGRMAESDVDSGWQIDVGEIGTSGTLPRFSQGNSLTLNAFDFPAQSVEDPGTTIFGATMFDAFYTDTVFEDYVYYYVGATPQSPILQRPLRLASDNANPHHRIRWNWRGQVYYDKQNSPITNYILQFTTTTQGTVNATGTNIIRTYTSNLQSNTFRRCPGDGPPSNNRIDGTRYFVREMYMRVLGRDPDQDQPGWDAWTSVITRCVFDSDCIRRMRIITARGFLESPEHFANNPALSNYGSPEYNREYVRLCYVYFVGRDPMNGEDQGWVDYINSHPGEYDTLVYGFIESPEFRRVAGGPVCTEPNC